MIRLPASLERKLKELFSRAEDRNRFVAEVLTVALEQQDLQFQRDEQPSVGGTLHFLMEDRVETQGKQQLGPY